MDLLNLEKYVNRIRDAEDPLQALVQYKNFLKEYLKLLDSQETKTDAGLVHMTFCNSTLLDDIYYALEYHEVADDAMMLNIEARRDRDAKD